MNSYIFYNVVETHKFKAKDSGINVAPLCLGNVSKHFSVNNLKKTDILMVLQLIMIVLVLMMF